MGYKRPEMLVNLKQSSAKKQLLKIFFFSKQIDASSLFCLVKPGRLETYQRGIFYSYISLDFILSLLLC